MSSRSWPSSPLDAAQRAFDLLTCPPAPLAFDGRGFAGLPDRLLPLDELRTLLLDRATSVAVRDAVWRELVTRARREGPAWVVAAVGVAMPGLRRMAGLLAAGWKGDATDLDAELIVGFLARLKTVDIDQPRVCGRLIDAGVRAVRKVRDEFADAHLVHVFVDGPRQPRLPWDHPDWVLARAVAAGVLDPEEAALIAATRLDDATVAAAAAELGMDAVLAAKWRRLAELRLRDAIVAGELECVPLRTCRSRRRRTGAVGRVLGARDGGAVVLATQQQPLGARHRSEAGPVSAPPGSWQRRPAEP